MHRKATWLFASLNGNIVEGSPICLLSEVTLIMNPYYQNWNYGYTLGASTDASRGAYTVYDSQQASNTSNQSTSSSKAGWSQFKSTQSNTIPKAQVFVTASPSSSINCNSESSVSIKSEGDVSQSLTCGPQATVTSQVDPNADALVKLHDLAASNKLVERYERADDATIAGSPNSNFTVNLFLGTETYQGTGPTIKAAKTVAAVQALASTKYSKVEEKKIGMFNSPNSRRIGVTATSELHELATKKGVRVDFKFLEPFNFEFKHRMRMWHKKEMLGNYRVQLNVAGYEFYGQAELPQQAKHNAATQAMPIVRNLPDPSGTATVVNSPTPYNELVSGTTLASSGQSSCSFEQQKNVNMALNEIAMVNQCVPEWTLLSEAGPPHQKVFTWQLTLGQYTTTGTGANKKIARNSAAEQMMATLPDDWKQKTCKSKKRGGGGDKKRAHSGFGGPPPKKKPDDGKVVITADNPISCLFEYSKKVKIADPEFECVAENLLETWQKGNQTYKKVEYTMQLKIDDKTYLAASNTKKAAKQACASEAWNAIRATLL